MTIPCDLPLIDVVEGGEPGPVLAVLGGVHGNEYGGVLAARRLRRSLQHLDLRGTVRIAAPAHPAAWQADQRSCPEDGLNLARVFPGDLGGRPTERIAGHLTAELITGADLLIDLHTAGAYADMPLLAGYHADDSPLAARAAAAAEAFGAAVTWQHPSLAPGRSLGAAEERGIPSIYIESAGSGRTRLEHLQGYLDGLHRVLAHLGMVEQAPPRRTTPLVVRSEGDTDGGRPTREDRVAAPVGGLFLMASTVMDRVREGDLLGEIWDEQGGSTARVTSPRDGVVMMLRTRTRIEALDTLAIVAGDV